MVFDGVGSRRWYLMVLVLAIVFDGVGSIKWYLFVLVLGDDILWCVLGDCI